MSGEDVRRIQQLLETTVDGVYGPKTEAAVAEFQHANGLYDDGIVGPVTYRAMFPDDQDFRSGGLLEWTTVPAHPFGKGYDRFTLREDVVAAYQKVYDYVDQVGGLIPSSGSKRRLASFASSNRSQTSLHYIGRALDLFVYAAMQEPETDPLIVEPDPINDDYWLVWARVNECGQERTLDAWVHAEQTTRRVTGEFVCLTSLFREVGFERIRKRRSYAKDNYGASEWWHFQYEVDLVQGQTRFGDELQRVYTLGELRNTGPWESRHAVWGEDWN